MYHLMVSAAGLGIAGLAVLIACGLAVCVEHHRERLADRETEREEDLFLDSNPRAFLDGPSPVRAYPGFQQDAAARSLERDWVPGTRRFLGSGPNLPGNPS